MKILQLIIILFILFTSCKQEPSEIQEKEKQSRGETTESKLHWHWEDNFTPLEKEKIKKYITAVSHAAFKVLGNYPFDIHYYFHRSNSQNEPIPWAHTERKNKTQGVRFYINPNFSYEVLFADWTAPHEISHLSLPFLGKENSWFSEGYASYMQYQIMQELGIYTKEEVVKKYQKRIENIQSDYSEKLVFIENAQKLRARYNFPAMYWGGAKFFMQINQRLIEQEGITLNDLIREYQSCCRNEKYRMEKLLQILEKDLKTPVFTNLYEECHTKSFVEIYKDVLKIDSKQSGNNGISSEN